jgi:MFS family permease
MTDHPPQRWRIIALFFLHALMSGAIHTRIPDLQLQIGLDEAQLGMVLMGLPLGALTMFLFSSRLIEAFGPRGIILIVLPLMSVSAAMMTVLLNPVAMFALLAINGMGFSVSNIAINVEADRVEAATGSRVMNTCHGVWSVGFLATSLLGAVLRGFDVSPALHLWVLYPLAGVLLLAVLLPMAPTPARAHSGAAKRKLAWPTLATLALVGFGLGAAMLEGASRAWSIIYLRDNFMVPAWVESLALPALLAAMALGRLLADRWIDRFGPVRVARVLASIAIAGLVLVVLAPSYEAVLAGFGLVGLGICVLYPLTLSAGARLGDRPASENVASITLVIQLVNLGSPLLIGWVAQQLGIRAAFGMLLPVLVLTWIMARQLTPRPLATTVAADPGAAPKAV